MPGTVIIKPTPAHASTTDLYRATSSAVPFIGRLFNNITAFADAADFWLDTQFRTRHFFVLTLAGATTFSGRFQGTLDGTTWFDLVPEAGSTTTANPITQASAPGFWIFSGAWKYMRFNPTAIGVAGLHCDHSTVRL